jgi:hypothetical protein
VTQLQAVKHQHCRTQRQQALVAAVQYVRSVCTELHSATACRGVLASLLLLLLAVVVLQAPAEDIQVQLGMFNSSSYTRQARVWQLTPALLHEHLVDAADV